VAGDWDTVKYSVRELLGNRATGAGGDARTAGRTPEADPVCGLAFIMIGCKDEELSTTLILVLKNHRAGSTGRLDRQRVASEPVATRLVERTDADHSDHHLRLATVRRTLYRGIAFCVITCTSSNAIPLSNVTGPWNVAR
jgi:hypothetical protein